MTPPAIYTGHEKLVLSIDIGTTTSAVALAHLAPGTVPMVQPVTKFENTTDASVPTEVYYNANGKAVACGANCRNPATQAQAQSEGWHLVQFFKLALHPQTLQYQTSALTLSADPTSSLGKKIFAPSFEGPDLPNGTTIQKVYADFIQYLLGATALWFADVDPDGARLWAKLFPSCEVILATPDGWNEIQQNILRKGLDIAGIVPLTFEERCHFVREAEASINYAMKVPDVKQWMKAGENFTVIDAGGSTVDVGMYTCEMISPKLKIREVKPSDCIQAGGVFVDRACYSLLTARLGSSIFAGPKYLQRMIEVFESRQKRKFTGEEATTVIRFGESADRDAAGGVKMGRITLTKAEVETIFHFCVNEIIASVQGQIQLGSTKSTGFGQSPYLQKCLRDAFPGLILVTAAEEGKKVVADGGLMAFITESVAARAVRSTFGVVGTFPYIPSRPEHAARTPKTDYDGKQFLDGCWSQIVQKGDIMSSTEAYERYCFETVPTNSTSRLANYSVDLWVYNLQGVQPDWAFDRSGRTLPGFQRRCTVTADLSPLKKILTPDPTSACLVVDFRVCLYLAQNTLRAKIKWLENRMEREGPATITFDEPVGVETGSFGRQPAANVLKRG
ncbi:hypothetical protein P7C70_g2413, partial [Phenoliferia sp. Uapishka_3]